MNDLEAKFVEKFESIDFQFCNTNWWPLIRVQVAYQLHLMQLKKENYSLLTKNVDEQLTYLTLRDYLSIIKSRLRRNSEKKDIAIFTQQTHYVTPYKDKIVNQFTTPFIDFFNQLSISYNLFDIDNFSDKFYRVDKNKRLYRARIVSKFRKDKNIQSQLSILNNYLQSELSYDCDFYNFLSQQIIECETNYMFFKWYLKQTNYSYILLYCYYNNGNMSLLKAANELKIPTIEYQHSQVTSNHFAYSNWGNSITNSTALFPSKIWVWRDSDVSFLKKEFSALPNIQIFKGGNVFISQFDQSENKIDNKYLKVLITLQGVGLPPYIIDYIANSKDVIWHLRLHPRYPLDGELVEKLKNENPDFVETEDANNKSIYELLADVDYHLTNFSGSAVEAQSFNVTNIIYGEKGFTAYKEQIENDLYLFINNEKELNDILINKKKGMKGFDSVLIDRLLIEENIKSVFCK